MGKKSNEFGVTLTTTISALLFCSLIIIISLSPLSELGPNANKFGSIGMWSVIGKILVLYIVPLGIYKVGLDAMRFIMAVFCSLGVVINIAIIMAVLALGLQAHSFFYLVIIVGICIAALMVNFIWFFVAFRPSKKPSSILNT